MEDSDSLPDAVKPLQRFLSPYIKQRQDVNSIRRVLTIHLSQHVDPRSQDGSLIARPLSLSDNTKNIDASSGGLKGSRKELLRCLRSNAKARSEYAKISKQHQLSSVPENPRLKDGKEKKQDKLEESSIPLDSFLELVKQRRKHERLRIVQDYIEVLSQKPAAAPDYLEPYQLLDNSEQSPPVPPEILNATRTTSQTTNIDLKDLVEQLERSVLRAKLLLKREQKLLAKVRASSNASAGSSSLVLKGDKLHALGTTRNELINWIETELAKAGDSPDAGEDEGQKDANKPKGKEYVDHQVASISRQYHHYMNARQALILAAAGQNIVSPPEATKETEEGFKEEPSENFSCAHPVTSQFIDRLLTVSNDQKSIIQQKSHLTISLAKQLKESSQGLDRLAHESHLLPAYPMPASLHREKKSDGNAVFEVELSRNEKPDSSRRARAWVYAADSASNSTNDAILQRLEDGDSSISHAIETISELKTLLGTDVGHEESQAGGSADVWAKLDGRLGSIKREDV